MSPSVEPFNEAKYKALMDGLDFQEINKSELENEFDIELWNKFLNLTQKFSCN